MLLDTVSRLEATIREGKIWFIGGTDNPYNYDGVGYDGRPSEPSAVAYAYDIREGDWQLFTDQAPASMDHRGLVVLPESLITVGGMESGRRVSVHVRAVKIPRCGLGAASYEPHLLASDLFSYL